MIEPLERSVCDGKLVKLWGQAGLVEGGRSGYRDLLSYHTIDIPCCNRILTNLPCFPESARSSGVFSGYLVWWGKHLTVPKEPLLTTGVSTLPSITGV